LQIHFGAGLGEGNTVVERHAASGAGGRKDSSHRHLDTGPVTERHPPLFRNAATLLALWLEPEGRGTNVAATLGDDLATELVLVQLGKQWRVPRVAHGGGVNGRREVHAHRVRIIRVVGDGHADLSCSVLWGRARGFGFRELVCVNGELLADEPRRAAGRRRSKNAGQCGGGWWEKRQREGELAVETHVQRGSRLDGRRENFGGIQERP